MVLPAILPGQALAVPLHLTSWRLQSRPKDLGLFFCKAPIHWTSVEQPGEVHSSKRECHSADFDDLKSNFRYVQSKTFISSKTRRLASVVAQTNQQARKSEYLQHGNSHITVQTCSVTCE